MAAHDIFPATHPEVAVAFLLPSLVFCIGASSKVDAHGVRLRRYPAANDLSALRVRRGAHGSGNKVPAGWLGVEEDHIRAKREREHAIVTCIRTYVEHEHAAAAITTIPDT
jgi:hypothetical protein